MRLICPSCSATYNVDAAAVGAKGRMVRCSGCGAEWFQTPREEADEPMELTNAPAAAPAAPAAEEPAWRALVDDDEFDPVVPAAKSDPVVDEDDGYRSDSLGPIYYDPSTGTTLHAGEVDEDEFAPVQEETKSRRRASADERDELAASLADVNSAPPARGGGAFLAGFSTVAVLAVIGIGVYVKADEIVALAPAAKPAIASYIELVDKGRVIVQGFIG